MLVAFSATLTVSGCAAKPPAEKAAGAGVAVEATDTACAVSPSAGQTGTTRFAVTNNGSKVTEFYVYDKDGGVLAEVENISPGLRRELTVDFVEPGDYRLACKPGMVGDGIRADFTVRAAP